MNIVIGQNVRSFDFASGPNGRQLTGERACFVEGVVTDITTKVPAEDGFLRDVGHKVYVIAATKRVFGGKVVKSEADTFYPPVNGINTMFGRVTDGVEVI